MNQLAAPIIGIIITSLLALWRTPAIRDGVFAKFAELQRALQWLAPLCLSMLASAV
jgi:hypothetical protein